MNTRGYRMDVSDEWNHWITTKANECGIQEHKINSVRREVSASGRAVFGRSVFVQRSYIRVRVRGMVLNRI